MEALVRALLVGAQLREIGPQQRELAAGVPERGGRASHGLPDRTLDGGFHVGSAAQGGDLREQVAHGAFEPRHGRVGVARSVEPVRQGEDVAFQGVEPAAARADAIDLLGHRLEPFDQLADGAGLGVAEPLGERLEPSEKFARQRPGGIGRLELAADLLQQRLDGGDPRILVPLELGDLSADRLHALSEALDPLRAGQGRHEAADLVEFAEHAVEGVLVGRTRQGAGEGAGQGFIDLGGHAFDFARDPGMDVVGYVPGQPVHLDAHQLDRCGDGGELLRVACPPEIAGDGLHGLLQLAHVAARGEPAEHVTQPACLALQLGDGRRRLLAVRPLRVRAGGERSRLSHLRPGRAGGVPLGNALFQLALAPADLGDGVADLGGEGAAAPAEGPGRAELPGKFPHLALDVADHPGGLGLRGFALFADRTVERVEAPHHRADRGFERGRRRERGGSLGRGSSESRIAALVLRRLLPGRSGLVRRTSSDLSCLIRARFLGRR